MSRVVARLGIFLLLIAGAAALFAFFAYQMSYAGAGGGLRRGGEWITMVVRGGGGTLCAVMGVWMIIRGADDSG